MTERCWLECPICGTRRPLGPHFFGCSSCVDASGFPHWLEVRYDLSQIDSAMLRRVGRVWDYAPLLPFEGAATSLGEGNTPLLKIKSLNAALGLPNLWLKWEGISPTGSFKDRLHAVSMAVGRELGFERAVIVTTGNSGVAAAAYAVRNGMHLHAFVHPNTPAESRWKMERLGARVTTVDAQTAIQVREQVAAGAYPCTLLGTFAGPANPYGVEGYKTIAFEVAAQLGRAPDRLCVPVSGGDALYGPYKGFLELRALGLCDTLPQMTACQSDGADFIARTRRERRAAMAVVEPDTLALSIGDPTGSECIRAAIDGSDGAAWIASDAEILAAVELLARHGLLVEAASAAPVAALTQQARRGALDSEETVVAVLTATAKY